MIGHERETDAARRPCAAGRPAPLLALLGPATAPKTADALARRRRSGAFQARSRTPNGDPSAPPELVRPIAGACKGARARRTPTNGPRPNTTTAGSVPALIASAMPLDERETLLIVTLAGFQL